MGNPRGCLTFSKLNDLGYVGACEGDIDSTLTMLIFAYAFGVPGFTGCTSRLRDRTRIPRGMQALKRGHSRLSAATPVATSREAVDQRICRRMYAIEMLVWPDSACLGGICIHFLAQGTL
jgi:hypothetical protein